MTLVSQKIVPYLWFDHQAREAAAFYCSVFNNSTIRSESDLIVEFEIEGTLFTALNGGPRHQFTEAISFMIMCDSQEEVDYYWNKLIASGGSESMCAWLKDKYGLSWQVVPTRLLELMKSGTPDQSRAVMQAMLKMRKIIIKDLEYAYENG